MRIALGQFDDSLMTANLGGGTIEITPRYGGPAGVLRYGGS